MESVKTTVQELKKFGLMFGPIAILISLWQSARGHWGHVVVLAPLGLYVLIMAVFYPRGIFPVRWVLEKVFHIVLTIATYVILTVCFYVVFTPVAIILRLLKKDLLSQSFDEGARSYWQNPERAEFDPQHYQKQF